MQIEFRGWDVDKKEMIYINSVNSNHLNMTWDGLVYENGKLQNIILMPFTGILDANGKKIYEGDVVKFDRHSMYNVTTFIAPIVFKKGEFKTDLPGNLIAIGQLSTITIIGNIYENPELLS